MDMNTQMGINNNESIGYFGIVTPGRNVITEFRRISETKYVIELSNPDQITDITFFLLPNSPVPPNYAAVLYFSVQPFTEWQPLGCIFSEKPSAILRTSWTTNPDVSKQPIVELGISIESLESVKNMGLDESGLEERKAFSFKIAMDLFNFMSSYNTSDNSHTMILPTDLFNKWMKRFEDKYKIDPNFMMKS